MVTRIEVSTKIYDTQASIRKKKLENTGFHKINSIKIADVYTIDKDLTPRELSQFASMLANPITQGAVISTSNKSIYDAHANWKWAIEIGFLPGVTDNISSTAKEMLEDRFGLKFKQSEGIYTSQITYLRGELSSKDAADIASSLSNPLINRISIKNYQEYLKDKGMDFIVPKVVLEENINVSQINLNVSDREIMQIGKEGVENPDGTRRGPLALSLPYMKTIKGYFKKLGRNPTDIELESLAQTWSEHCKHTIFADPIDEITDGLFKHYIKGATDEIRKKSARGRSSLGRKRRNDKCVSVFNDNSGAVEFDDDYLITHKVETHNTPSALDPFGGSITGIVGVNRDTIGFGLGAKPIANYYGFCFADPRIDTPLYKRPNFREKMLSSRRIMDGVIEGVNAGGNQSGIPTPSGFLYFDERYRGKPLVFVGTIGLIPRKIKNKPTHIKKAQPGDYIVMVGGRVGKDGIHGATFSSEALGVGSPVTAVQIGDPITQKKLSDALIKEARDLQLFHSITDNGAGGLSCSVAEMAKEGGGCKVELEKVPLKYPGLAPWEIWISESQERMTLAVAPEQWPKFSRTLKRRGVEATIIGKFTNTGRCQVSYKNKTIMDIDLQFLHYGLPKRPMETSYPRHSDRSKIDSRVASLPRMTVKDLTKLFLTMLGRLNIAGYEFISQQYDHIVQGNLVLGPLQGRGRVNSEVTAIKPVFSFQKGVIMSYGLYPSYSDIDTYYMAAASIDTGIRNIVAAGGDPNEIYLLDNFCWCSSDNPYRLGQLKRAAKACFDFATYYQTPFISGKDSMFNDFEGFDRKGNKIKISIPPTLLITSIGITDDVSRLVSLDFKQPGDLIYLLGDTDDELGGSEYFSMHKFIGNNVPKVEAKKNKKLYQAFYEAITNEIIASSISVGRGGLAVALAKSSMGGMLGMEVSLKNIAGQVTRDDFVLFSESQGRLLVTVCPERKKQFEKIMEGTSFALIGKVTKAPSLIIAGLTGKLIVNTSVEKALLYYRAPFSDY